MNLEELTKLYDFKGKTFVVTGGAGILCGEMACALVGCGASVAMLDATPAQAEKLKPRLEAGPGRFTIIAADVLKRPTLEQAAERIVKDWGRVDGLLNGAGGNNPRATTGAAATFFELPEDALRFVTDLNLLGTIIPSQVFGKLMAAQKEGIRLMTAGNGIQKTQKITRAMKMVAAAKLRRRQSAVVAARPYAQAMKDLLLHLTRGQIEP